MVVFGGQSPVMAECIHRRLAYVISQIQRTGTPTCQEPWDGQVCLLHRTGNIDSSIFSVHYIM